MSQKVLNLQQQKENKMAESLSIKLQPQTISSIEKIAEARLNRGIKDSKSRIVAEAVADLAQKVFNDARD